MYIGKLGIGSTLTFMWIILHRYISYGVILSSVRQPVRAHYLANLHLRFAFRQSKATLPIFMQLTGLRANIVLGFFLI